ncbi:MAG: hypothetical protein AAF907_09045 [Planctomycetota bacterium]
MNTAAPQRRKLFAMTAAAFALLLIGPPGTAAAPENPVPVPERLIAVAPGLYSGAEPVGDAHFAALAKRGVKTVISVDGPVPDAATARRHGLRTVHVPIGYDSVPADAAATLHTVMIRFGPTANGPHADPGGVFVHCHHGKHRGPSAAAVCGLSVGLIDRSKAFALLDEAGLSPRYAGLRESVRTFIPSDLSSVAQLPEAVPPAGLTAAMIEITALLDELENSGSRTEETDGTRTAVRTLLTEALRESARLPDLPAAMRTDLHAAAALAERADSLHGLTLLKQNCTRCHTKHRD